MSFGTINARLAKLEERQAIAKPARAVFSCIVRKGHEDEDRAAYFAERNIVPTDEDLILMRVIVLAPGKFRDGHPAFGSHPRLGHADDRLK